MKNKIIIIFFALALILAAVVSKNHIVNFIQDKPIVILYDNDVHCEISRYPFVAFIRDSIASNNTNRTALVSSGDFLQGSSYGALGQGMHIVKLLNAIHYDVLGIGNHEFDYKTPRFLELSKKIEAPIVSANFTDTLNNLIFEPYIIKELGGKRIAFVGILTPDAMIAESYAFYDNLTKNKIYDLHMDDFAKYVQHAVDKARHEGHADYVVALSHLGEMPDEGEWTSQAIVSKTKGIDVVLDGHSHSIIQDSIPNIDKTYIPRIQTGTKLQNIGKLEIFPNGKIKASLIPIDTNGSKNPFVQKTLDSINEELAPILNKVIGSTDYNFTINDKNGSRAIRNQETNLGDFTADAFLQATKAQISFVNGGGIRAGIAKGEILYKNAIDVFPSRNSLCTLKATGKQILDFLEIASSSVPSENGGFAQVSGLKYTINLNIKNSITIDSSDFSLQIKGERRVQNVEIADNNGSFKAIDTLGTYLIGTTTYIAYESGENKTFSKNKAEELQIKDSEALIDFIKNKLNERTPEEYRNIEGQGRITIIPEK